MNVPYDNGKVKIGIYYQPPAYVEQDSDMIYLQGCLLGQNANARKLLLAKVIYGCLFAITFALCVISEI